MKRFTKGDRVLTPVISREIPLAEIVAVFEATDGEQILEVRRVLCSTGIGSKPSSHEERTKLYRADQLTFVGDRQFLNFFDTVIHISTGARVAKSLLFADSLTDFLNEHGFELPKAVDQEPASDPKLPRELPDRDPGYTF